MTKTQKRVSAIFNEWAKRYAEDPGLFSEILDENGVPIDDYGEECAIYFTSIEKDMIGKGILPKPLD